MKAFIKAKRIFISLLILFTFLFNFYLPVYSDSHIKIIGVSGQKAPDVPLADTSMPDVVLDASLAGDVNVDVSTLGVPDGTTVKVKFKDEENINPPEGIVESGMSTVPINLKAGNAKVIYAETGPYVPFITKSASNGKLDADTATVGLYHLDSNILDVSGNGNNLTYYPGWEGINYVDGVNPNSKGIYFWSTTNTYENRRVHRYENPNGSGFTSIPKIWSSEFAIKPFKDLPSNEVWYPFLIQDQHILVYVILGRTPWGAGDVGKFTVFHFDSKGAANSIQIPNPFTLGKWSYVTITHDGNIVKLYINGEEKGSVISEGNLGPQPWGNYGVAAGAIFGGPGFGNPYVAIDEIRISNLVRNREELANNTQELLGTELRTRTQFSSKTSDKTLKLVTSKKDKTKTKKGKPRKEIRLQAAETLSPQEGEAKKDNDTVALFHFNGTTKDSVTKKVLAGDPETIDFEAGKSGKDNSAISFEGKDDLLLVNKKLFDSTPKEFTIDFFGTSGEMPSSLPTGILTIDNGQIFAMVSYAKTFEGKTILSASSLDASGKSVVIGTEHDFPADKWTHLALVYKDKKLQFLINGKPVGEVDLPSLYKKGDGKINVGSDGGDGIFNGQIDELRISDVARSQAELEVYAKR